MVGREKINQYDFVEIIRVPEQHHGVIDIGDIGVVVEKYNDENFEIECIQPDGSYKWLETLNIQYISKILRTSSQAQSNMRERIMPKSITLGAVIGTTLGSLMGAGCGAITMTLNGTLLGLVIGLVLGLVSGILTAALTVKTAGTTGGISVGYFTGLLFGGAFGVILGALIPTSLRLKAHTEDLPMLDALMMGRFETAILGGFLLSILAASVGAWIGGKNLIPRDLKQ